MAQICKRLNAKYEGPITLFFQKQENDQDFATWVSNFNTEKEDYQQLLQMQVLVPRLERLLDRQVSNRVIGCLWMYTAEI